GGSKAHWLSRAYSDALLVRSPVGVAVEEAPLTDIVARLLAVLGDAAASIARTGGLVSASPDAQPPRRFRFVHDAALGPVLERAYAESQAAMDRGDFGAALLTSCSILDAMLADALGASGFGIRDSGFASGDSGLAERI